jgi:hypothetical protein
MTAVAGALDLSAAAPDLWGQQRNIRGNRATAGHPAPEMPTEMPCWKGNLKGKSEVALDSETGFTRADFKYRHIHDQRVS